MFSQPKHSIESLQTAIARLEAQNKSAATLRVRLKDMMNAKLIADLKAARRRARQKEVSAV